MSGQLIYTYNTYTCNLRTDGYFLENVLPTFPDFHYEAVNAILTRMNVDPQTVRDCQYCIYDTDTSEKSRLAYFITVGHEEGTTYVIDKFYHIECVIDTTFISLEEPFRISDCKVYVSQPFYGQNIELFDGIQIDGDDHVDPYWQIISGYCGKWYLDTNTVPKWIWKMLYGCYVDRNDGDTTYVIIPPKSFFVDGEHEDFIPPGTYKCSSSDEVTVNH